MKMPNKLAAALMLAGLTTAVAQAAEPLQIASIAGLEGKVMIHKGKNYTFAKEGQALVEGDRVVALRDSKADVAFSSGCVTNVAENTVLAIDAKANCAAGTEPVKVAQAIGSKTDVAVGSGDAVGGGTGMSRGMVLAGFGVAALSAPLIVNATTANDGGSNTPISGQ
jgi:hypothetical protein